MQIQDLLKTKGTKIGGSILGGTGLLALVLNMMNQRIDSVEQSIQEKEAAIMQIVDTKHSQIVIRLDHIDDKIVDIKELLIKMDNRIYEINKKDLYSDKNLFKSDTN